MNVELVKYTEDAELLIENAMRISHGGTAGEKPNAKFIKNIIALGHESPLEHASASFLITGVSRALSHQLVRHRLASYTQKSQRYVKEDQFEFVIPDSIINKGEAYKEDFEHDMSVIQEMYNKWCSRGILREDARYVLPNACCTDLYVTMNFRELRTFFGLRCAHDAQWEIRKMAQNMLCKIHRIAPIIFDDLMTFASGCN